MFTNIILVLKNLLTKTKSKLVCKKLLIGLFYSLFCYYLRHFYKLTVNDYQQLIQGYKAQSIDAHEKAFVFVFSTHAAGTASYNAAEAC